VYKKFEINNDSRQEVIDALQSIGYMEVEFFSNRGSQALAAASLESPIIVAFRGTEPNLTDIGSDLKAWRTSWPSEASVHAGFASALNAIWGDIDAWLDKHPGRWLFTGHSLGAALSTLAASLKHPAELISFGSPRVGDSIFADMLEGVTVYRYVNCCDVVCRIPPDMLGFRHVAPMIYIDRAGEIQKGFNEHDRKMDQFEARTEYLIHEAWKVGTVESRDLADHIPLNYVSALFP
jgi:pimeloyl-ACP methyl ester carboxylesterase